VTLVDSNVLIDVFTDDQRWFDWSLERLEEATLNGPLLINDVVYAEASIRFQSIELFAAALERAGVAIVTMPRAALFLAGKAFMQYRRAGGVCTGVFPEFFIGAHAAVGRLPLLTRDARRYRSYFPTVTLIAPDVET
jgi:predicted nucleic acid-binding protein